MFLNLRSFWIGGSIAGAILFVAVALTGGIPGMSSKGIVQIDFGIYPEELEGLEVEIDGEVVGTLQRFGSATRTGFELAEGRHEVRVLHPELESVPKRIDVVANGLPILLVLDVQERSQPGGEYGTVLTFQ